MLSIPESTRLAHDRQHIVCRTNDVVLSDFTDARRDPTRPPKFRDENFDRQFDATTLFYDAVGVGDSRIVLLAPPFFNLAGRVAATSFFQTSALCPAEIRRFDRHAQIWLTAPRGGDIRATGPL